MNDDGFIKFNTPTQHGICALRITAGAIIHLPQPQELGLY
jgi:hypothetical protein